MDARYKRLKNEGFGPNVLSLAQYPECHSDDELGTDPDTGRQVFFITPKEGRSASVTSLFRLIDKKNASSRLHMGAR